MTAAHRRRTRRALLVDGLAGAGALATACARTGSTVATSQGGRRIDVAALRRAVAGSVLTPGDPGYERFRPLYNKRFDTIYPAVLVLPARREDVGIAIAWARQRDIPLHPRGGGHSYLGNSIGSGMVLDLRRLARVEPVLAQPQAFDVGGGARLMPVAEALGKRGLALPLGSCPSVGVGGFTLGGGIGLSSRLLGLGCDRLQEVEMITADGRTVRANAEHNPELLWACKGGGGGQLGIVTRMRLLTWPAERVSWFTLEFSWRRAAEVVAFWQEWAPVAPRELTTILQLSSAPSLRCVGQFYGSGTQLARVVAPLGRMAEGSPAIGEGSPFEASRVWGDCEAKTMGECRRPSDDPAGTIKRKLYEARGLLFERALPNKAIATTLRYIEARSHMVDPGLLLLDAWGGAIADVPTAATAFAHRTVRFSGQVIAHGPSAPAQTPWAESLWAALKPFASDGMYSNYSFSGLRDWQRALWQNNLSRMLAQKRLWDPDDVFTGRQILSGR